MRPRDSEGRDSDMLSIEVVGPLTWILTVVAVAEMEIDQAPREVQLRQGTVFAVSVLARARLQQRSPGQGQVSP